MALEGCSEYQLASLLSSLSGFSGLGGTANWSVFVNQTPNTPDNCVVCNGGPSSTSHYINSRLTYDEHVSVQIMFRCRPRNFATVYTLWETAKAGFLGVANTTVTGYVYMRWFVESELTYLETDEHGRQCFVASTSVHRKKVLEGD